jgi:hypothetical protein
MAFEGVTRSASEVLAWTRVYCTELTHDGIRAGPHRSYDSLLGHAPIGRRSAQQVVLHREPHFAHEKLRLIEIPSLIRPTDTPFLLHALPEHLLNKIARIDKITARSPL